MALVNGDFDRELRRALHAAVDTLEPAGDGLERIRHRTSAPWMVRQTSLMLTECVDLARLIGIRAEPGFTVARATVAARYGSWGGSLDRFSSRVPALASIRRLIAPPRRGGAHGAQAARNQGWLRPALAVAAAVVIVVAGVFGLARVRDNLALSSTPAKANAGSGHVGQQGPALQGQSAPSVITTGTGTHAARPSPKATCSRAPKAQAKPKATPTPSVDNTPTWRGWPTPTWTPTWTPTPTGTTDPSPTSDSGTGALQAASATMIHTKARPTPATAKPTPASTGHCTGSHTSK
jgi:hypothetical protein